MTDKYVCRYSLNAGPIPIPFSVPFTSGARWHDRFADTLRKIGFAPCKADTDVWMRETDGIYEYIGVYVGDLMML